MKRLTSFDEIEALCGAMVRDFFRAKGYADVLCVDIEAFVREYLGLPVVYESFAEPDPGRIGFCADGERPLRVRRGDRQEEAVFPAGTVVIDRSLLRPGESARRRFTIAHEGAHDVLGRHVPAQAVPAAVLRGVSDPDAAYSGDMLREMTAVNECFTNRAAACLLMPEFLVERVLERCNGSRKVVMYRADHRRLFSQDQKLLIQRMADAMGVSYTALGTRLRELDLYERRPVEEYVRSELRYGGEVRA